jgi:hypothetical protein
MPIDLYYTLHSPSCRPVLLVAKAVGVELNLVELSVKDNAHRADEFLKVSTVNESNVKFKVVPCLIKQHTMKAYEGVEI